jgi:hypothetical protein
MDGDIGCMLFVSVKRFFFGTVVAGDFDVEADRLLGILFVLVDAVARFGEGGRMGSSFVAVDDVNIVNDGADDDNIARDDNGEEFELLLIVKKEDDVVVIDDETGLFIIKRGVGFVRMEFVFVGVVAVELV